jgi:hypothetical protein
LDLTADRESQHTRTHAHTAHDARHTTHGTRHTWHVHAHGCFLRGVWWQVASCLTSCGRRGATPSWTRRMRRRASRTAGATSPPGSSCSAPPLPVRPIPPSPPKASLLLSPIPIAKRGGAVIFLLCLNVRRKTLWVVCRRVSCVVCRVSCVVCRVSCVVVVVVVVVVIECDLSTAPQWCICTRSRR